MPISWRILIDWDGDGSYAHDESTRVTGLRIERGRRDQFGAFEAGKATLWLENNDRRFDPYYAASPLHPHVLPRRGIIIQAGSDTTAATIGVDASDDVAVSADESLSYGTGAWQFLFGGRIEDIEPSGPKGSRVVCLTAYDGLRDLAAAKVAVALQQDIQTHNAVAAVLDAAGWPAGARVLDASSDTMSYWWTEPDTHAKAAADQLAAGEYGAFFISRAGDARFINRANYTADTAAGSLDEDILIDLQLTAPWASVANDVRVRCYPTTLASLADLWILRDYGVQVTAGSSRTIWVEYTDAYNARCAADGVLDPVATTDYQANTLPSGAGTDMTASMTVTASIYDTWAKLVVANTHGSTDFYITLLKIRGEAITRQAVTLIQEDATSQAAYGRRQITLDLLTQQSVDTAESLAEQLLAFLAEPTPSVTVRLDNRIDDLLAYDLCDLLAFTSPEYSLTATMRVDTISLWTGSTMQDLKGEFVLNPAHTQGMAPPWLLETTGRGELGQTTYLGW